MIPFPHKLPSHPGCHVALRRVPCAVYTRTLVVIHFNYSSVALPLLLLSRFSRVRLCATPWTAALQAPPSLGFSRQEHWSELPFSSPSSVALAIYLWTSWPSLLTRMLALRFTKSSTQSEKVTLQRKVGTACCDGGEVAIKVINEHQQSFPVSRSSFPRSTV